MTRDWDKIIQNIDGLNVSDKIREAKAVLREVLEWKDIPRNRAFELVLHLCNAGMPDEAIDLLTPYVRAFEKGKSELSPSETVAYARALIFSRTGHNAVRLLEGIQDKLPPSGLYMLGLAYIIIWEHDKGIKAIEEFLTLPGVPLRDQLIAKLNLCLAMRFGLIDIERAEKILEELIEEAVKNDLEFVARDARREYAYLALVDGRPEDCVARFKDYDFHHPEPEPEKWPIERAWLALAEGNVEKINKAKDEIRSRGTVIVLRFISFLEGKIRNDRDLLLRIYFSSPYPFFKRRIRELLGEENLPRTFDLYLKPDPTAAKPAVTIDLMDGDYGNPTSEKLKLGGLVQRMLWHLCSDPFKRARIWHLFELVFPGEMITPDSARLRIEQGVFRLRSWIKQENLPLEIKVDRNLIWVEPTEPCAVRITDLDRVGPVMKRELADFLAQVKKVYKNREFTTQEVVQKFGISLRTTIRRLQSGVEHGALEKIGTGPLTRYRFPD